MKVKCVCNRSGYEHLLKVGNWYELIDICTSMLSSSDYYITVQLDNGKSTVTNDYRFDVPKKICKQYVQLQETINNAKEQTLE